MLLEERGRRLPTSSGRQAGPRLSVAIPPATGNHSMCCLALTEWPILAVEHLLCANEKLVCADENLCILEFSLSLPEEVKIQPR